MLKFIVISLILITGCYAQNRHIKQQFLNVRNLGSYDLACASGDLQVVILDYYENGPHPNTIGVFGCGQRASYRRNLTNDSVGGWKRVVP